MRKLSKLPHRVRSFFGHKTFRYAASFKITPGLINSTALT